MKNIPKFEEIEPILGIVSILGVVFLIYYSIAIDNMIRKNPEITTAVIVDYKKDRQWIHLVYEYSVNGVKYKKTDYSSLNNVDFNNFKNKRIPVVYQKNRPKRSYLLLTPEDFGMLGKPFPDSLRWLLKYD